MGISVNSQMEMIVLSKSNSNRRKEPSFCVYSDMNRMLFAFLSIDLTVDTSSFSTYSNSGLFKELQVDIVSSKEIEPESDLHGEIFMLLGISMLHGEGSPETFVVG